MTSRMYKIGEAAKLLNLKDYVLRFWETEFTQIQPVRTEKGQRLYREEDLAMLKQIKHLLHEQGLTIDGARKFLTGEGISGEGLSSSVLNDGYKEFSGDGLIQGRLDLPASAQSGPTALEKELQNDLEQRSTVIRLTLAELREIKTLLEEQA